MTAVVLQGDARRLPLADASVDLIVTSPPYWGLRSYQDGGEHYDAQIGAEPTPAAYVDALIDCTREWMRVLKPSGSLWLNLGDKYANKYGGPSGGQSQIPVQGSNAAAAGRRDLRRGPIAEKSLIGLPWRYAMRCIDDLGLTLRAEIIWSKPNGLPESVTDRVRRSHEQWFHFVQQPRYFSAVDEIREPASDYSRPNGNGRQPRGGQKPRLMADTCNPLGRLPGSVWEIATQPLTVPASLGVDHFAAFPLAWPQRIIRGWSPSGICTACGEGRRPVAERIPMQWKPSPTYTGRATDRSYKPASGTMQSPPQTRITGYACGCSDATAPTRPAVVVDPFGGTGTTALVADVLGRTGISIDASLDYCRIAKWRTTNPAERARAMGVPKPPVELPGQQALFDLGSTT